MWWCALAAFSVAAINNTVIVYDNVWLDLHTSQGPVRGHKELDDVFVFYGIPYATTPTGENKFKAPSPPPNWTNMYVALDYGTICPQAEYVTEIMKGKIIEDDCLVANVYVPDTQETNLPVVVYIHGGAFQIGFGDRKRAKKLMSSKKIIVVTFNYRLGIQGFLCLGTEDIPGNAGMKDMIALLRWVKKNIHAYGGNRNDVTISGYSTGAAAVDLLILSKSAVGLFQRAIVESGASLAEFAVQIDPLDNAKMYARLLNFSNESISELETFYKTVPYILLKTDNFLTTRDSTFIFTPCVERDVGEEMFLHDSPMNILKKGDYIKVPMLYGFTNMEGLIRVPLFDSWKYAMNDKFSLFLPDLKFKSDAVKEYVAEKVRKYYFGNKLIDTDTILEYVNYFTDIMFASPALRSVRFNVKGGNDQIYLYHYSFVDDNVPYVPYTKVRGADHCAQSKAIFDDTDSTKGTAEYNNMRKLMRELWHNFITTGKPVPENSSLPFVWPPTAVKKPVHMSLGNVVELRGELLGERGRFWANIYQKYYLAPRPPGLFPSLSEMSTKSRYRYW